MISRPWKLAYIHQDYIDQTLHVYPVDPNYYQMCNDVGHTQNFCSCYDALSDDNLFRRHVPCQVRGQRMTSAGQELAQPHRPRSHHHQEFVTNKEHVQATASRMKKACRHRTVVPRE